VPPSHQECNVTKHQCKHIHIHKAKTHLTTDTNWLRRCSTQDAQQQPTQKPHNAQHATRNTQHTRCNTKLMFTRHNSLLQYPMHTSQYTFTIHIHNKHLPRSFALQSEHKNSRKYLFDGGPRPTVPSSQIAVILAAVFTGSLRLSETTSCPIIPKSQCT
jgi:hypothetical protein